MQTVEQIERNISPLGHNEDDSVPQLAIPKPKQPTLQEEVEENRRLGNMLKKQLNIVPLKGI